MNPTHFHELPLPMPLGLHASEFHRRVASALRECPDRWALVKAGSRSACNQMAVGVRRGYIVAYAPPGSFEADVREAAEPVKAPNGRWVTHELHVRYLGAAA